ncbi:MAG TPA: zinc finger domain-containing protein [Terriglobia bacterium]|nr:zinc finger domain-containing protein [Terriglobia bacterium]
MRCGTPIRRITVCGRSSHFCPHCQRSSRASSSPIGSGPH